MRGLLEKDLRLLKGQKNFFLIILLITVFLSLNSEDNFAVTYLTFIAGFLTISSFGYDDNGNCMPFLLTLPVSRTLYVKSPDLLLVERTAIANSSGAASGSADVSGVMSTSSNVMSGSFCSSYLPQRMRMNTTMA